MNDLDDLFSKHPALRKLDPNLLRQALADRALFDRLVAEGDSKLSEAERDRVRQVGEKIRAAAHAKFAAKEPPTEPAASWLATKTGWLRFRSDQLHTLTAAAASVTALATEVLARVLLTDAAAQLPFLSAGALGVDRIDPETGARTRCDDCAIEIPEPPTLTPTPQGSRFTCAVAFDFFGEPELAKSFDGGACLLEFTDDAHAGGPAFQARLATHGMVVRATFDAPARFTADASPTGRIKMMRLGLVPPGSIVRTLLAL